MENSYSEKRSLAPAFSADAVPVVFASSNQFVPFFAACLKSLLNHISSHNLYDIVLIHQDVSEENQDTLRKMIRPYSNVSLRFFDAAPLIRGYGLKANAHISVETYFRFLIQQILPGYDKVLYLDCDLIVNADVAELYEINVEDCLLAAVRDVEALGHLNGANRKIQNYLSSGLGMRDPGGYFQAGVLLINEARMRQTYSLEQWLTFAAVPHRYNDQDVLNLYCEGKVKYLDMSWNVLTDCDHTRVSNIVVHAPKEIQEAYREARIAPKIIHYAGCQKPWQKPTEDMAQYFWSASRETPYYEEALYQMALYAAKQCVLEDRRRRSPLWKARRGVKKILSRFFRKG